MKLAEALILRADQNRRIEQLKARLLRNAKVQEGETPAESPEELVRELEGLTGDFTTLVQRINRTNSATPFDGGTLSDALTLRDVLAKKQDIYRSLAETASVTQTRYSASEIRLKSTVDVAETQKRADDLAKEYRELDAKIQEANWKTELL